MRALSPNPARDRPAPAAADVHDGRPPWTPPAPRACRTPDLAASVWNRKRTGSRAEPTDNTSSDDCRAHCGLRSADRTGRRPGLPGNTAPGRATDRRPLPARKPTDDHAQSPPAGQDCASGIVDACGPKSPDSHRVVWGLTSRPPVHPVGLPPVSRLPAGFFPFVRLTLVSLRPAFSGCSPSAVARFWFPFDFSPGFLLPGQSRR